MNALLNILAGSVGLSILVVSYRRYFKPDKEKNLGDY